MNNGNWHRVWNGMRRTASLGVGVGATLAAAQGCAVVLGFDDTEVDTDATTAIVVPEASTTDIPDTSTNDTSTRVDGATTSDADAGPDLDADASWSIDAASLPDEACLKLYPATKRVGATIVEVPINGQDASLVRATESSNNIAPVKLAVCDPGTKTARVLDYTGLPDFLAPFTWDFGPIQIQPGTTQFALVYGKEAKSVWVTTTVTH